MKTLYKILVMIMVVGIVACEEVPNYETDQPRLPETPTEEEIDSTKTDTINTRIVKVVTHSIAQDTCIDAEDVNEITITYADSITIVDKDYITLNGAVCTQAYTQGKNLHIPVSLMPTTEYVLMVGSNALTAGKHTRVANFALRFDTRATINTQALKKTLCNANAHENARLLFEQLISIYGQKTIAGATEPTDSLRPHSDAIYASTGRRPALMEVPLDHIATQGASNISRAITQHESGGFVAYSWLWKVPQKQGDKEDTYSENNDFDIAKALIDVNWEFQFLEQSIDSVASHLKQLSSLGIPVLFSPLQSINQHWWSKRGARHAKALWQLLYDRLTAKHQLNNLIWVWSVDTSLATTELDEWYPGDKYVDIVSISIDAPNTHSQSEIFLAVNQHFEGSKMLAIAQCGNIPNPDECYRYGDTWLYFAAKHTLDEMGNIIFGTQYPYSTTQYWHYLLHHSSILGMDWSEDEERLFL